MNYLLIITKRLLVNRPHKFKMEDFSGVTAGVFVTFGFKYLVLEGVN